MRSGLTVCCADILSAKAVACSCCEGRNGPHIRHYPDAMRFSSNGYFFFFLAVFFFAFFAFLAMLPSVIPKVGSVQVDNRHAYIQATPQIAKLILRASKRVNDRQRP